MPIDELIYRRQQSTTPRHRAALRGKAGAVELLIELGADPDLPNEWEFTPLCTAAAGGYLKVMRVLLAHGVCVHGRPDTIPPIGCAASGNHPRAVDLLLAAGADINGRARSGDTSSPIERARLEGLEEMVRHLLKRGGALTAPPGRLTQRA